MKPTFLKQMVPRRGLGHTSATPAALASAALRVPTQSAQALCFLGSKMKKGRHEADLFKTDGAQERTRTSTVLPPLGPEPSASTNSATWARFACCDAKDRYCSVSATAVNSFLWINRKRRATSRPYCRARAERSDCRTPRTSEFFRCVFMRVAPRTIVSTRHASSADTCGAPPIRSTRRTRFIIDATMRDAAQVRRLDSFASKCVT